MIHPAFMAHINMTDIVKIWSTHSEGKGEKKKFYSDAQTKENVYASHSKSTNNAS